VTSRIKITELQAAFNGNALKLIRDTTIIVTAVKVLKYDMGMRCTCSPLCSGFLSFQFVLIRLATIGYFIFNLFGRFVWLSTHTYTILYNNFGRTIRSTLAKGPKKLDTTGNQGVAALCWLLWLASFVFFTAAIVAFLAATCILWRRVEQRRGWGRRFDLLIQKIMRLFLGSSRMMVAHHEYFGSVEEKEDRTSSEIFA